MCDSDSVRADFQSLAPAGSTHLNCPLARLRVLALLVSQGCVPRLGCSLGLLPSSFFLSSGGHLLHLLLSLPVKELPLPSPRRVVVGSMAQCGGIGWCSMVVVVPVVAEGGGGVSGVCVEGKSHACTVTACTMRQGIQTSGFVTPNIAGFPL